MVTRRAIAWALGTLFLIAGCAAGRDFVRPDEGALVIGRTTYKDIFLKYGTPVQEGTAMVNDQVVKIVDYLYSSPGGTPVAEGVTPARRMGLYFVNDVLVGHSFTSSFKDDNTDFDESKVKLIRKGETTGKEVLTLLGRPSGVYTHPLVKEKDAKGLVYTYGQARGEGFTLKGYQKVLIVTVDSKDVVTDVQFTTAGQR